MSDRIKELEAQLAAVAGVRRKIDVLNALAYELSDIDPERMRRLSEEAYSLATSGKFRSQPYPKGLAESQLNLGRYHLLQSNYDLALSHFIECLSYFEELGQLEQLVQALNGIGATYLELGDYANALEYMLGALDIADDIENRHLQAVLLNNLGSLFLELNTPAEALSYLSRCLQTARDIGEKAIEAAALDKTSNAHYQSGDYAQALAFGLESVRLCRDIGVRVGEADALNSVGDAYQAMGDPAQALAHFEQALRIAQEIGQKYEMVEALMRIGKTYQRQGQAELGLNTFEQALNLAEEIKAKREQYQCHQMLAEIHKEQRRFEQALQHHEWFHAIENEVFNEEADSKLKILQVVHRTETAKKEAEIYQLRNVALEQEIVERKRAEAALQQQNRELDAFAHTVAHDLKVPLGIVAGYLDMVTSDVMDMERTAIHETLQWARESAQKAIDIVEELLLLSSVRKKQPTMQRLYMADIVRQARARLAPLIDEYQAEVILPAKWPVATGYAPWVEEVWVNYLANGLKYGGHPPRLELGATPEEHGMIRFWVRDNGPGLTDEEQANLFAEFTRLSEVGAEGHGLGLSIVRRIMEKLGGEAGVESQAGAGSMFYFTLASAGPQSKPPSG
jgi:signal transduction histidine kinase